MKRALALLAALLVVFTSFACAEPMTIDPDTATNEEIASFIDALNAAVKARQPATPFQEVVAEFEKYKVVIQNCEIKTAETDLGLTAAIVAGEKYLSMSLLFAHKEGEPKMFVTSMGIELYQNGRECPMTLGLGLSEGTNDKVLADTEIPVTISYKIFDTASPFTGYIAPLFSSDDKVKFECIVSE